MLNVIIAFLTLVPLIKLNEIFIRDIDNFASHYQSSVGYFVCGSKAIAYLNRQKAWQYFNVEMPSNKICRKSVVVRSQINENLATNIPNYTLARP